MNNVTRDSYGNPLPASVLLGSDSTLEQLGKALGINGFLALVHITLRNGDTVSYDQESKRATITACDGYQYEVVHE